MNNRFLFFISFLCLLPVHVMADTGGFVVAPKTPVLDTHKNRVANTVPQSAMQNRATRALQSKSAQANKALNNFAKKQNALLSDLQQKIQGFESLHKKAIQENRAYAIKYQSCKRKTYDDFAPNHIRRVCGPRPSDVRSLPQWNLNCMFSLIDQCAGEGNQYSQTLSKLITKGADVKSRIDQYVRGTQQHLDQMN